MKWMDQVHSYQGEDKDFISTTTWKGNSSSPSADSKKRRKRIRMYQEAWY
jgi:hypothetical protein